MKLQDALQILASEPHSTLLLAGGTDLMVQQSLFKKSDKRVLDLTQVKEMNGVRWSAETVQLGATTTYSQIIEDAKLCKEFPMLASAAKATGALAIQNRGTLGGNIANASPAADSLPVLLAYEARIKLSSVRGERKVAYDEFHCGYKERDLASDEIIVEIEIPRSRMGAVDYYEKVGTRAAQAISKVGIAATCQIKGETIENIRLAFSSLAAVPLRCKKTENVLEGRRLNSKTILEALDCLKQEITPIDDIRSEAVYRKQVACNLLGYYLTEVVSRHSSILNKSETTTM